MSSQLRGQTSPEPPWSPCPRGELQRLGRRLRLRRSRRQFLRGALFAGLALSGGTALWLYRDKLPGVEEPAYAGITCSEVRRLAPEMMAKKLPAAKVKQIEAHAAQCSACQQMLTNMGCQHSCSPP